MSELTRPTVGKGTVTSGEIPAHHLREPPLQLKDTCGVVEHGIFIGMTTAVIIAGSDGISVKLPPK
jgi:ribose 5-phosphate isomerase